MAFLALAGVVGVLEQLFPEDRAVDRLLTIAGMVIGLVLVLTWCLYDARERSYSIGRPLKLLIIFLAVIGVPVYLVCTRGRRAFIAVVFAALFFGLCALTEQVAIEITYQILSAEPEPSTPQLPNGYRLVPSYSDGPRAFIMTAPGKPLTRVKKFKDGSSSTTTDEFVVTSNVVEIGVFDVFVYGRAIPFLDSDVNRGDRPGYFILDTRNGDLSLGLAPDDWRARLESLNIVEPQLTPTGASP